MTVFRSGQTPAEREAYIKMKRSVDERKLLETLLSRIPDRKKRTINSMFLAYQFDPAVLTAEVMLAEDGYQDTVEDLVNDCVNSIFVPTMDAIVAEVGSIGDDARTLLLERLRMSCQVKFDREVAVIKAQVDEARITPTAPPPGVAAMRAQPGRITDIVQLPVERPREDYAQKRKRLIAGAPRLEEVLELDPRQFRKLLRRHSRLVKQVDDDPLKKEELAQVSLAVARYFEAKGR